MRLSVRALLLCVAVRYSELLLLPRACPCCLKPTYRHVVHNACARPRAPGRSLEYTAREHIHHTHARTYILH